MRILSFLVLSLVFQSTSFAYTVILQSGKRIVGTMVGEDRSTLQLKDADGILISFNKATLDLTAMAAANQPMSRAANNGSARPKASARIYTRDDLDQMPALGIVEGDRPELIESDQETSVKESTARPSSAKEERSWRSRAVSLKKEMARLREKQIQAEASCDKSRENLSSRLATP
jgi:hypothetical protein